MLTFLYCLQLTIYFFNDGNKCFQLLVAHLFAELFCHNESFPF